MKRLCKKLIAAFLAAMLACGAPTAAGGFALLKPDIIASAAEENGKLGANLTWRYDSSTATMTVEGSGAMGFHLTSIETPSYNVKRGVRTIILPDGLTEINSLLCDYRNLTNITIPDTVTSIGERAFYGCTSLTSITIPDSVTSIGRDAFEGTPWLNARKAENPLVVIGNNLINGKSCSGDVVIPDGVTSIGEYAFYQCAGLTSVTIPDGVTSIGDYAFSGCTGLTSAAIPDSVTNIGECIFFGCSNLKNITLPESLDKKKPQGKCGEQLSWSYDSLTGILTITGSGKMTNWNGAAKNDPAPWYDYRERINSVILPEGLTTVGSYAFFGCNGLKNLTIPESVTSFGCNPFLVCEEAWFTIGFPASLVIVAKTGSHAAKYAADNGIPWYDPEIPAANNGLIITDQVVTNGRMCSGEVVIPEGVTAVSDRAFADNDNITAVTFPSTCTKVGAFALYHCPNLEKVTFLNPQTTICQKTEFRAGQFSSIGVYALGLYGQGRLATGQHAQHWAISNNSFSIKERNDHDGNDTWFSDGVDDYYVVTNWSEFSGTIYGEAGSTAETFARNFCNFKSLDGQTEIPAPEQQIFSGGCGGAISWYFETKTGTLRIEGKGRMEHDYADVYSTVFTSWRDFEPLINTVVISDQIMSISDAADADFPKNKDLLIKGYTGSLAEEYAARKGYRFESLGEAEVKPLGNCGADLINLTWAYDWKNKTLIIEGTGPMSDFYARSESDYWEADFVTNCPWGNDIVGNSTYDVQKVLLPDGLTHIGDCAFFKNRLKSINIPDSVTSIGDSAFYGCTGLTSITIPEGVTSIGDYAFYGCTGLTSVTIPGSVTSISDYAFYGCTGLTSITIPGSVTSIGDSAFYGCTGLTSVTIPESVTNIGECIFFGCSNLKNITLPESLDKKKPQGKCGEQLSWSYDSLTGILTITGSGKMTNWNGAAKNDPAPWYDYRKRINSVILPEGLTTVGSYAFSGCNSMYGIDIPSTMTRIYAYAFSDCALGQVSFPDGLELVGVHAFAGCWGLARVTLPESLTEIGKYAFAECRNLRNALIPPSVTAIGDGAFDIGADYYLTIQGYTGTAAEKFASKNKIKFESLSKWGDVNCDDSVDVADAVLICRFAVGDNGAEITDQGRIQADVTHDGRVDVDDSQKLVLYIAKYLTKDDLKQ